MAHSNRNKQKEKRKAMKAARKAARQAEWSAMAGTSKNKKKKGQGRKGISLGRAARILMNIFVKEKGQVVLRPRMVHGGDDCRNVGCKRCSNIWRTA